MEENEKGRKKIDEVKARERERESETEMDGEKLVYIMSGEEPGSQKQVDGWMVGGGRS